MADGYLAAAVRGSAHTSPRTHGLFSGLGGLSFAATTLQRPWPPGCLTAAATHARLPADSTNRRTLDLISGLTGTGACLLSHIDDPQRAAILRTILTTLSSTPPLPDHGIAHGTAGLLALLSLALQAGIEVPNQRDAVQRLATALTAARTEDPWGTNWPAPPSYPGHARGSWCQGSPGIARALWLAGTALDDQALRELACAALKAALRRPASERRIDTTAGLCHGLAGLLQITLRFAHDTADPAFQAAADTLVGQLLALRDPALQQAGFLQGAAGAVLALLAATTTQPPMWDRALLLA